MSQQIVTLAVRLIDKGSLATARRMAEDCILAKPGAGHTQDAMNRAAVVACASVTLRYLDKIITYWRKEERGFPRSWALPFETMRNDLEFITRAYIAVSCASRLREELQYVANQVVRLCDGYRTMQNPITGKTHTYGSEKYDEWTAQAAFYAQLAHSILLE